MRREQPPAPEVESDRLHSASWIIVAYSGCDGGAGVEAASVAAEEGEAEEAAVVLVRAAVVASVEEGAADSETIQGA